MSEPDPSTHPGVVLSGICERCGTWHHIRLTELPDDKVRPICWHCGERPLTIVSPT